MGAKCSGILVAAGLIAAAAFFPIRAGAIEVKKDLFTKGGGGAAPIARVPPTLERSLNQTVADDSAPYDDEESEKKSAGQPYADLDHAKFVYVPRMVGGTWNVQVRLEATEYLMPKSGEGKPKPTGKRRALLMGYKYEGGKWVSTEKPKWLDVGSAAAAR